jgi:hypothetical protein
LSYATVYYGLEVDPAIFKLAVRALAEGNALRAIGLLSYRVPATFLDQLPTIERLFPAWDMVHHSN